jgi:hypothetical protein
MPEAYSTDIRKRVTPSPAQLDGHRQSEEFSEADLSRQRPLLRHPHGVTAPARPAFGERGSRVGYISRPSFFALLLLVVDSGGRVQD